MALRDILLRQSLRPRVVHRLPGRLRVTVPLLRHVPEPWRAAADCLPALLCVPEGVESVALHPVSGTLLLKYDTGSLGEGDVLQWLNAVGELIVRHQERFAACRPEDVSALALELEAALRRALGPGAALDLESLQRDDVWKT